MPLRPGRTVRDLERPYTRQSQRVPKKSYVVGVPFPKTHQFEMGNRAGVFDLIIHAVAEKSVQIRDNSLEAARIVANHYLDAKAGPTNYFLKILKYPHHVLREKPIATGAGADRYSQGMAHAFGKPAGTAVQIHSGENLLMLRISKQNLETAKLAIKKFGLKISTPLRVAVEG